MANVVAWALFVLGITHIVFGIVRFKAPLAEAVAAGFVGQFKAPEIRRTAFWFLMCGPLLILAGHVAIHAVAVGDLALLKVIGVYMLVSSVVAVAVVPKSPSWASLLISLLLIAAGYGMLT